MTARRGPSWRGAWVLGLGTAAVLIVAVALVWPRQQNDVAIPDPPAEIAVSPPWHLLAPESGADAMTTPPRPLNAEAVRRALDEAYPPSLREQGIAGTVGVLVEIDETGRVTDAALKSSSGQRALDSVAVAVVRTAEFEPAYNDGVPVAVTMEYEIPFRGGGPPVDLGGTGSRMVELVVVYLGMTECVPCQLPETKQAVREVLAAARSAAAERKLELQTVGAALDRDIETGLAFLRSTAAFDQVVVGGSWSNLAVGDVIWSDSQAVAGVPQVVILTRTSHRRPEDRDPATQHVFVRLAGESQIRAWLDAGGKVF